MIPTFQNPSGRTLSEERRRRIVELAREHDLLVFEDDPYGLVRYEGESLPSLLDLSDGAAIYSSSFSKTIAPGLRVGWFVFPEPLARPDTSLETALTQFERLAERPDSPITALRRIPGTPAAGAPE